MALSFFDFISQAMAQPSLFVILLLVIGVTAVSGATDAPNAIATVVSTRCLRPNVAIALAAVFNFVGLVGMTYISTAVAKTMFGMVDFSGNTDAALYALMAAMIGAILWGIFCWFFGIPCSKSHSLIAGVTGGAIALNGLAGVVPSEWAKVIYGMVFSLVAGFLLGWLFVKIIERVCKHVNRQAANHAFTGIQDVCAVALSFLHGAQDGQKFMSIAMLGIALSFGNSTPDSNGFPMWLMITCSLAISLGTIVGGKRIIKSVGMDMVKLEKYQGVAAHRHARFHRPLQHLRHHGRGRKQVVQACELGNRSQHGACLGTHVPRLRPYRLSARQPVHDVRLERFIAQRLQAIRHAPSSAIHEKRRGAPL